MLAKEQRQAGLIVRSHFHSEIILCRVQTVSLTVLISSRGMHPALPHMQM